MKPRIFIGSSSVATDVADAIQIQLDDCAECTVWTQAVFSLGTTALESLMDRISASDCAIFVFAPDDKANVRGTLYSVPHDNVIFELGLFTGALGPSRCFFLIPHDSDIHIPTDLLGITSGRYNANRRDGNLRAAVNPFCVQVREKLRTLELATKAVPGQPGAAGPSPDEHVAASETELQEGTAWTQREAEQQRPFLSQTGQFWATSEGDVPMITGRLHCRLLIRRSDFNAVAQAVRQAGNPIRHFEERPYAVTWDELLSFDVDGSQPVAGSPSMKLRVAVCFLGVLSPDLNVFGTISPFASISAAVRYQIIRTLIDTPSTLHLSLNKLLDDPKLQATVVGYSCETDGLFETVSRVLHATTSSNSGWNLSPLSILRSVRLKTASALVDVDGLSDISFMTESLTSDPIQDLIEIFAIISPHLIVMHGSF